LFGNTKVNENRLPLRAAPRNIAQQCIIVSGREHTSGASELVQGSTWKKAKCAGVSPIKLPDLLKKW
jgi:hypothetical protein